METKDLQQLLQLLATWRDQFPRASDAWTYCTTVMVDVTRELAERRHKEAAATH